MVGVLACASWNLKEEDEEKKVELYVKKLL